MKNVFRIAFLTLAVTFAGTQASLANNNSSALVTPGIEASSRLNELRNMDVKNMSRKERKEIRQELRTMQKMQKKEMSSGGGVYLSAGAVILIIILLIILL